MMTWRYTFRTSGLLATAVWLAMAAASGDEPAGQDRSVRVEQTPAGKSLAILIGIQNYDAVDPLAYCHNDVQRLAEILREHGRFDRVVVMVDDGGQSSLQPTLGNLHRVLRTQLMLANTQNFDRVLVYFSGHGFRDEEDGKLYLAPKDCDPQHIRLTGLPQSFLKDRLDACDQVRMKLVVLDCCHAGEGRAIGGVGRSGEELAEVFTTAQGVFTLASSRRDEVSLEWPARKQGLFTYWLCEGLAGKADKDGDGIVDGDEIHEYVYNHVLAVSVNELGRQQTVVQRPSENWQGKAIFTWAKQEANRIEPYLPTPPAASEAMRTALATVADSLAEDLKERGQHEVSVGHIIPAPKAADSTSGPGLAKMLVEELALRNISTNRWATLGVQGTYVPVRGGQGDGPNLLGIRIRIHLVDELGTAVASYDTQARFLDGVFDEPDAGPDGRPDNSAGRPPRPRIGPDVDGAQTLCEGFGLTVALPTAGSSGLEQRHDRLEAAMSKERRAYLEGTQVRAEAGSPYALELLVDGQPRTPQARDSLVFVPLDKDDLYAVRLINRSDHDAAVTLAIDGLSVFTFSQNRRYRHYIVPARSALKVSGWHRDNERSDAFLVTDYSDGVWTRVLSSPSAVGTITATFAAAWAPGTEPPADEGVYRQLQQANRSGASTTFGPPVQTEFREVRRIAGLTRASVSIRYTK